MKRILVWLLILVVFVGVLVACGNKKSDEPVNMLHESYLKTIGLKSLEGNIVLLSTETGDDENTTKVTTEIDVTAAHNDEGLFAAQLHYTETGNGLYFVGNERYSYSGKEHGGPCQYTERGDLVYDVGSSVLSFIMVPTIAPIRLQTPDWLIEYSMENFVYTSEQLLAMDPEINENAGETTITIHTTYNEIIKALLPDSGKHTNIPPEYQNYDCTLVIRITKEGYISYLEFGYEPKEAAEMKLGQVRTLTITAVDEDIALETPRQLALPSVSYTNYQRCEGDLRYVFYVNDLASNRHPGEIDEFVLGDVMGATYSFCDEPKEIPVFEIPTKFYGKPIVKANINSEYIDIQKLIVPSELNGAWSYGSPDTEVFLMWERKGTGNVSEKYKGVYYKNEWEYVKGVPTGLDIKPTITFSESSVSLQLNQTMELEPVITGAEKITYESDSQIVLVDKSGVIKAQSPGKAVITVSVSRGEYTASASLEVTVIEIEKEPVVQFFLDAFTLQLPGKLELKDYAMILNAKSVEYTSSDETVFTVDSSGRVVGVGAGTAVLTIRAMNSVKTVSASVSITVIAA